MTSRSHHSIQDPFVHVLLDGKDVAKTKIMYKTRHPTWDEKFKIELDGPLHILYFDVQVSCRFQVKNIVSSAASHALVVCSQDDDLSKNDYIGRVTGELFMRIEHKK